jgi:DNA/RNA-binding domain of Phe-tRNA-synthetase-like protein
VTELSRGSVADEIREEFPGLRLLWGCAEARPAPSPPALRRRLAEMSNRYRGSGVIAMRSRPVERAFRTFYRQIGLDPDVRRIPSEQAAVVRLRHGGFPSADLISDARLVALLETGVPVWALDAGALGGGPLAIGTAGESLAGAAQSPAPPGSLVVTAGDRVVSVLFEEPASELAPRAATRQLVIYAVAVDGVPEIHLEEALWACLDLLGAT